MDGAPIKHDFKLVILRADEEKGGWKKPQVSDWIPNLFVGAGADWLATFMSTSPGSPMNHMHVGTGTTAAALGDTTLVGAVGSRVAMQSRTANQNILTEVATFAGFVTGITSLVLREIGIFNHAVTGGTMRSRAVFSSVTLGDSDYLQVNYRTTVATRA